jgi:hypothetical protein
MTDNVTDLANGAFFLCSSLTSFRIPAGEGYIGDFTFSGCNSLTSIVIPENITGIGIFAFDYCQSLASVEILNSEIHISQSSFDACYWLNDIYFVGTEAEWAKIVSDIDPDKNTGLNWATIHYNYVPEEK